MTGDAASGSKGSGSARPHAATLAERYAVALFALAQDAGRVDAVRASLDKALAAADESPDFKTVVTNPLIKRGQAAAVVTAVARALDLDDLVRAFLGVLAQNRRLGLLAAIRDAVVSFIRASRGQLVAQVTSVDPLSSDQRKGLETRLSSSLGHDITLVTHEDPSLLGGIIVRVGSRMVDASVKSKLDSLALAMKG